MDVGLRYADDYVLDSVYAWAFPAPSLNASINPLDSPVKSSFTSLLHALAKYGTHGPSGPSDFPNSFSHPSLAPLQSSSLFPRDSIARQSVSLWLIAIIGAYTLYFTVSTINFYALFDRRLVHHPRFLKNQIRKEIILSVQAAPIIDLLIVPWWVAEIRGHTLLYDSFTGEGAYGTGPQWSHVLSRVFGMSKASIQTYGPWFHGIATAVAFLAFTDYCIYWIHRWLHIPAIYKHIHKPHHRWLVPTPFAALAFHPLDGYAQSVPYHVVVFMLPLNKFVYLGLFVFVQCWTIFIHDGDMITGHFLEKYINSPAHHTLHHLYFTCNYGQYFTFADNWGGSYRAPRPDLDPIHDALKNMERKRLAAEREERKAIVASAKAAGETEIPGLEDVENSDSGYEGSEGEQVELLKGKKSNASLKAQVEVWTDSFREETVKKEALRKRR